MRDRLAQSAVALGALALLLSACGSSSSPSGSAQAQTTSTTSSVTTVAPSPIPGLPPLTYSFSITGTGGKHPSFLTPEIQTDSILRVKIQAGPASQLDAPDVSYSNFSANYSCIVYTIRVAGQQVNTQPLSVGYGYSPVCASGQGSQVIDFSTRLTPGHGPMKVEVVGALYDFYCNILDSGVPGQCTLKTVYKNHTVTGTLQIQVNGTSL